MDMIPFFKLMADKAASDLYFSVGAPPCLKIEGVCFDAGKVSLSSEQLWQIAKSVTSDEQQKEFEKNLELNIAVSLDGIGRYRVNLFKQRGEVAMVVRYIKGEIPSIEALNLPIILQEIIMEKRGLVLVVGATNSGKSTTLASMIDYRNTKHKGHILTIEDPIEYIHSHKASIVNQREVGLDTLSYANALKNAMREAPDLILIGEVRDAETMKHAIAYAETGHLCLATLHANNANQSLDRVLNFFQAEVRSSILFDLSLNLKAIISLRLIPGLDGQQVPAVELLLQSPYITDLIAKGKLDDIKEVMERDKNMQTFDESLVSLYNEGKITKESAIKYADSKNNVALKIRLSEGKNKTEPKDKYDLEAPLD